MFDAFCPHTNDFAKFCLGTLFLKLPLCIYLQKSSVHWRCSDPFVWSTKPKLTKIRCGSEIYPWLYRTLHTVSLFFIIVNDLLFVRPAEPERPEGGRELCQRGDQPSIRRALTQGANQGE
jgi:hypothetical protein